MDTKYLTKRGKIWHLNFRLPTNIGGELVRVSLKTSDIKQARKIRDEYIYPIIHNSSVIDIAEKLIQVIDSKKTETAQILQELKNQQFLNSNSIMLDDALELYLTYLKNSKLRKSTLQSYVSALKVSFDIIGDTELNKLTKNSAVTIRDSLMQRLSTARLSFNFQRIRQFLDWCDSQGLCKNKADLFKIKLPKVRKKPTSIIPESKADQASTILGNWIVPIFARYTGCRLNELIRLTRSDIVIESGIMCFRISEKAKNHKPRLVPVATKLEPYLKDFNGFGKLGHKDDKYNKLIKAIPGCETCSFHSWRVYFNSQLHKNNTDPYLCKLILGHTNSKDIHSVYTRFDIESMKKAVDKVK